MQDKLTYIYDPKCRLITVLIDNTKIKLAPIEAQVFETMQKHVMLTHGKLLKEVYNSDAYFNLRSLNSQIYKLNKKIKRIGKISNYDRICYKLDLYY